MPRMSSTQIKGTLLGYATRHSLLIYLLLVQRPAPSVYSVHLSRLRMSVWQNKKGAGNVYSSMQHLVLYEGLSLSGDTASTEKRGFANFGQISR
jgi:hypothetical protein